MTAGKSALAMGAKNGTWPCQGLEYDWDPSPPLAPAR